MFDRAHFETLATRIIAEPETFNSYVRYNAPRKIRMVQSEGNALPRPIGPFSPDGAGEWVLAKSAVPGWALGRERIGATAIGSRVALVGESVAASFGYAPQWRLCEAIASHSDELDVLDLTRPGLEAAELIEIVSSLKQIELDGIIIFAGNNWWQLPVQHDEDTLGPWAAEAMSNRDWQIWHRVFVARGSELAQAVVAKIAAEASAPVTLVVPQSNLLGWNHAWWTPAWLRPVERREWIIAARKAEAAASRGEFDCATHHAHEVLQIDGGASPRALQITALCTLADGHHKAAWEMAGIARNAVAPWLTHAPPQIPDWVRESLLKAPVAHIVDVDEVLLEQGPAPSRIQFLDYCHLTATFLAKLAVRIAAPFSARSIAALPPPAPETERAARVLAAFHSQALGNAPDPVTSSQDDKNMSIRLGKLLSIAPYARNYVDLPPSMREYLRTFAPERSLRHLHDFFPSRERILNPNFKLIFHQTHLPDYRYGGTAGLSEVPRSFQSLGGSTTRFVLPERGRYRLRLVFQTAGNATVAINGKRHRKYRGGKQWHTFTGSATITAPALLELKIEDGHDDTIERLLERGRKGTVFSWALEWGRIAPALGHYEERT